MLSAADNDILCRVGPGTPMGNLMRQYWIPAIRSDELPAPDCPPLRVKLLGEELIGFRTTSGAVGLVQNACPHRGASLFFGRSEEEGLRCVYHGWKFDVTGGCVDMPSEPAESNFKTKVRVLAYPCVERQGVVWTYMGPRSVPPALPDLEPNMLPDGEYAIANVMRECNWMQALEGDIDTVHVVFLHGGARYFDPAMAAASARERAARYAVRDAEYGVSYGAYRTEDDINLYWRIAHFLFPFYSMTPTGRLGVRKQVRAWVPIDDEHTLFFRISDPESRRRPDADGVVRPQRDLSSWNPYQLGEGTELMPRTSAWYGRFQAKATARNDYEIDREAQSKRESYTGINGITLQDQAVTESMGTIYDRSHEHLGTSDAMVIRTRRRLIDAAKALRDDGTIPPGVDEPEIYRQRSGEVVLPRDADWWEATEELRKAFVDRPAIRLAPTQTLSG